MRAIELMRGWWAACARRMRGICGGGRWSRVGAAALCAAKSFCFPPAPLAATVVLGGFSLLAWTFLIDRSQNEPAAYCSYALSFWALVIVCAAVARRNPLRALRGAAEGNERANRIMTDTRHRLGLTTAASFGIDVIWALGNAVSGVQSGSFWFITLAAYYLVLSFIRLPLSRCILSGGTRVDLVREHRLRRRSGILLAVSTPVFAGLVILALRRVGSVSYQGYLVFVVAMYAFYAIIAGSVRFVRDRRSPHPVVSAATTVCLVVAGVSMLSLEMAMLEQFGSGDEELLRLICVGATGALVCIAAFGLGIWMAVTSSRALREDAASG